MEDEVATDVFSGLAQHLKALDSRQNSQQLLNEDVRARVDSYAVRQLSRPESFAERNFLQQEWLQLPLLPTTMIGSLPQTAELRSLRKRYRDGALAEEEYLSGIKILTADAIRWQESADIDVLVHGEFERTDMVEFFGEHLEGVAFTGNGWVQSYGARAVKPPVIYGDVSRKRR